MSSLVAEFKRMDDSLLSFSSDLREGLESPSSSEASSEVSSHASASPNAQSGGTMNNESGHLPSSLAEQDKIAADNKSVVGHVTREDSEVIALQDIESDAELTLDSDSSSDASSGAARILSSEQSRNLSLASPLDETKGDEKGMCSGDDNFVTGVESAKRDLLVNNNDSGPTHLEEEEKDFGQPVAPIDDTVDFTFQQQAEEKEEEEEESEYHDARETLLQKQSSLETYGEAEVHRSSSDANITMSLNMK
ncbi:Hypothetical Protein FCC1311_033442 [Hondaea fermentalgiana]|uniref:Uncharacterized protein n=1 Tax=Hondaea fermentalgiana TaxID=2315210 RepID=A0A2R5GFV2_9STRA|nr:Hypothetical Protein FCC1311_033442 [Hondaea fermentalgiana]|eukprot:GBG27121.1 Hypothetical Protein FCC1311_033442 [Hondaea fermentalgiana]